MSTPNILWICTDSQRWDSLGCYGNEYVTTPHIDALAKRGVVFENAFSQNPLCTPSRGCFLTGRYPVTNGLTKNGQNINPQEKLVTKLLADKGYHCGLSGKLHINACDHRLKGYGPEWWRKIGEVDFFIGEEPRIDDGYTEFHWDHSPNGDPSSSYTKWLKEKGGPEIQYPPRKDCPWVQHGMADEYHQTTFCVEKAIDFIQEHTDKPWLFSLNCFAPHYPFNPPDTYLQPYLDRLDSLPLPTFVENELETKPAFQKMFQEQTKYKASEMGEQDHRMVRAAYWAMCDHIDAQVGRLLQALEDSGQQENTMVIFTSDHGELLGDHGLYIKGPFLYDASIRVPLIISWPGIIPEGERSTSMVELGDLAPTLLDAVQAPVYQGMQAQSFWPHLSGKKNLHNIREDVYCEYYNSNPDDPEQHCTMVRTKTHKLIAFHGQEPSELYDLEQDPAESYNRWNDPVYAAVQADLYRRLCDRMAQTADPLPERIGLY